MTELLTLSMVRVTVVLAVAVPDKVGLGEE